jgi:glycosyltransferase involved in cell wall biosynthesis
MITIAIPFYNAETYIELAIQSVFNQTYQNWKLLLVDDGSKDNSLEIARKYESDLRVTIYTDGENKNLGYRLNQIPKLVDTKYIARMDADDIMHPEKIEKQIEILESHPEIDVLGTNAYSINETSKVEGIRLSYSKNEILSKVGGFIHPTIIAKKEWFINNPYDVKALRIEDAELWYRTSKNCNFQILTEPLFFYREFGNDYYKKYFKGFDSMFYALKKHNYEIKFIKFFLKYYIVGFVYFLYNLIGKEDVLVRKRNAIRLNNLSIDEVLKKGVH